jgi:hypothetical protein
MLFLSLLSNFAVSVLVSMLHSDQHGFTLELIVASQRDALRDFEHDVAEIKTDQTRESVKLSDALKKELFDQEQTDHE